MSKQVTNRKKNQRSQEQGTISPPTHNVTDNVFHTHIPTPSKEEILKNDSFSDDENEHSSSFERVTCIHATKSRIRRLYRTLKSVSGVVDASFKLRDPPTNKK